MSIDGNHRLTGSDLNKFHCTADDYCASRLLRRSIRSPLCVLALLIFSLVSTPVAIADDGRFEIVDVNYRVEDGKWLTDLRAELKLSDQALEALNNSIALTLQYQFEITRVRRLWPDEVIARPRINIELRYLSLSQRYLIHNLDTGEQNSYATLFSALRQIGQVRDFALIEANKVTTNGRYRFAARVVLNRENLPGPLQMLAFWRGDFSLESRWSRWTPK